MQGFEHTRCLIRRVPSNLNLSHAPANCADKSSVHLLWSFGRFLSEQGGKASP